MKKSIRFLIQKQHLRYYNIIQTKSIQEKILQIIEL